MAVDSLDITIPEGWICKPLIECTADKTISYGIVQPGRNVDTGIPIVRVNNFVGGQLDISSVLKVAPEIEEKFSRTRLQGGEVLLTLVGSAGKSVVVPESLAGWNVPRAIAVIRAEPRVGANWINIILQSSCTQNFLDARANTTVQKTLNLKDVRQIPVLIPPKKDKEFIESCITSLDEKIELNRQMNETLEQMAQALFKSWFVDFDPVIDNALDAGNPIPEELEARAEQRRQLRDAVARGEASVLGMPDEIRSLFPSEFELTEEMGWIPKGWKAGKLNDLLVLQRGFDLPKTNRTEGPYPLIASSGQDGVHGDFKVEGPGLVTGRSGRIGVVNFVYENFWPLNTTLWVKKFSASSPYHGFFQLKEIDLENYATGSAVPTLNRNHVHEHPCVVVPKTILDVFDNHAETLFRRVRSNDESNKTLARIRDYLLPKLISGELQIPDAEQQIAEVMS
jgi:type I restriction enzyme S subunit